MKVSTLLIGIALCASLASCGVADRLRPGGYGKPLRSAKLQFDGEYFRSKTRHTSDDRREFTVTLRRADKSPSGAVEAVQFEATKYCLGLFGGSDHVLDLDPQSIEEGVPVDSKGDLTVAGRCTAR